MPGTPPLISIAKLTAGFDSRTILRDVSFELPPSGIVGLIGPAGVGKSTLLRTLSRWNDPLPSFWCEGEIRYRGSDLLQEPVDAVRRKMALLSQRARLYTCSVADNAIAELASGGPLSRAEKEALAREVLEALDVWSLYASRLHEPVLSLSIAHQRILSLARLLAGGAVAVLADEPLRDLSPADAEEVYRVLVRMSERMPLLIVTHNVGVARRLCKSIVLLAAQRVVDCAPTEEFFARPEGTLAGHFVRYGNCWPKPGAYEDDDKAGSDTSEDLPDGTRENASAPGAAKRASIDSVSAERRRRPTGFHWIIPRLLGGAQYPGLLDEMDSDLSALGRLCDVLISLTEQPLSPEDVEAHGMRPMHFPIEDMGVPELQSAVELCAEISELIDQEVATVLHCKAGLGRTGTMLACTLIYRGDNAVRAIGQVRAVNPYYIQSAEQLAFLAAFSDHLRGRLASSSVERGAT